MKHTLLYLTLIASLSLQLSSEPKWVWWGDTKSPNPLATLSPTSLNQSVSEKLKTTSKEELLDCVNKLDPKKEQDLYTLRGLYLLLNKK